MTDELSHQWHPVGTISTETSTFAIVDPDMLGTADAVEAWRARIEETWAVTQLGIPEAENGAQQDGVLFSTRADDTWVVEARFCQDLAGPGGAEVCEIRIRLHAGWEGDEHHPGVPPVPEGWPADGP